MEYGNSYKPRTGVTLITGAGGEIGQELISWFAGKGNGASIVALDHQALNEATLRMVDRAVIGDILDTALLKSVWQEYEIDTVYHLAALLSTHAERNPELAYQVNVQGTMNLLNLAAEHGRTRGRAVKFVYPSSIAVYGIPDIETKRQVAAVREDEYLHPVTMYGCSKLSCEHFGSYYADHYQMLADSDASCVDFRCIRFPGLISVRTRPTGGTSDFAPEMVHAAAHGQSYAAFVRPDTQIPFMVMPDAINALLTLSGMSRDSLKRKVYNVGSFSLSAVEVAERVRDFWPTADITFVPDPLRQRILDSWPSDIDDREARNDWNWSPQYSVDRAFEEYISLVAP